MKPTRIPLFLGLALLAVSQLSASISIAVSAQGQKLMISGPSPYAVSAGKEIGRAGGNATDVAVAAAFALAVTSPYYASLGGGGFALIGHGTSVEAIDFREMAPERSTPKMFTEKGKNSSIDGGLAVGVPGITAGLWAIHKKSGHLPWSRVLDPAIALAEKGFEVSGEWAELTVQNTPRFSPAGKKYFLNQGHAVGPGDLLKQPQLAKVLHRIRNRGPAGFYEGENALDLVETVKAEGGVISLRDLKNYQVRWLKPLETDFMGSHLYLMPPPSSGGVVIKSALRLVELLGVKDKRALSIDEFHFLGEILKLSFLGRSYLGDPDFGKNPIAELTSEEHLTALSKRIHADKAIDTAGLAAIQKESLQTTHFSVMDAQGDAIAMTLTLNGSYGSGVVTQSFGVALNNEMDDFTTQPDQPNQYGLVQGEANLVAPRKRPLSSMSPTLVYQNGKAVMAIGSPGGPRIISAVFQGLYRSLVRNMDADQAIQTVRVHHQVAPNILFLDANKVAPEVLDGLRARGHQVEESRVAKLYIVKRGKDGIFEGAFDARGEGAAGGY